jgi:hypothetical protein
MFPAALIFLMFLAGCTSSMRGHAPHEGQGYEETGELQDGMAKLAAPAPLMEEEQEGSASARDSRPMNAALSGFASQKVRGNMPSGSGKASYNAPPPQQATKPGMAPKRLVEYSGTATLRSTEPERILDSAVSLAKAAGGYLEQRSPGYAALRVPSGDFDSLFARMLRLSEVVDYKQQAEDITEALQDTDLRLKVVVATLERLEDLIRKARTESQKLRLLGELMRFREEREVLEAKKRDLVQRSRFASIQLWVRTHAPTASAGLFSRDLDDFAWIHRLNPFEDDRFRGRSRLTFPAPASMVVTENGFFSSDWRATSSQGAEFWGSQIDVDLRGDTRFWREAVRNRLESGFKVSDTASAGEFLFCRFQSFGPTPYYYWIGVRSRGGEVDVAEFYFPNEDQQGKLLPGMLAAVERKPR